MLIRLLILTILLSHGLFGQVTFNSVDAPIVYGSSDPLEPTIFRIAVDNLGSESVNIDFIKSNNTSPASWDVSLCTDACLPPETDTTLFNVGAWGVDTVSVYFFADAVGQGSIDIEVMSQIDSSSAASFNFTAIAESANNIDELDLSFYSTMIKHNSLYINSLEESSYKIYDISGKLLCFGRLESGSNRIACSRWISGFILLKMENRGGKVRTERLFLEKA